MFLFEDWAITGAPYSDKGRGYLYIREIGEWKYHQSIQESDGGEQYVLVKMWKFLGKLWLLALIKDDGNGPDEVSVCVFMMQGET